MKTIRLINLFLAVVPIAFVGCGGEESQPQTPAPQTPAPQTPAPQTPAPQTPAPQTPAPQTPAPQTPTQLLYRTALSTTSNIMQKIMNQHPIQDIDAEFLKSLYNNQKHPFTLSTYHLVNSSKNAGYSFMVLNCETKPILEIAFTWNHPQQMYGLGIRGLSSNDPSVSKVQFINNAEKLFANKNINLVSDLARFLANGQVKISGNLRISRTNNSLCFSDILCAQQNASRQLNDINDLPFDLKGIIRLLVKISKA